MSQKTLKIQGRLMFKLRFLPGYVSPDKIHFSTGSTSFWLNRLNVTKLEEFKDRVAIILKTELKSYRFHCPASSDKQ